MKLIFDGKIDGKLRPTGPIGVVYLMGEAVN